jgi:hypothetical protein
LLVPRMQVGLIIYAISLACWLIFDV